MRRSASLADCLSKAGIPFSIRRHRWKDFGANRTAALRSAHRFIDSLAWHPARSYWLFLDADFELVVERGFRRRALTGAALSLRQQAGALEYWNVRLARADLNWRAVGATHEHYQCDRPVEIARVEGLWIRDHWERDLGSGDTGPRSSTGIAIC